MPIVRAIFDPPAHVHSALVFIPDIALAPQIQTEVNSIISHYRALRIRDFENVPIIGGPMANPEPIVNIHHATVALSVVKCQIANPPNDYPTLFNLKELTFTFPPNSSRRKSTSAMSFPAKPTHR